MQKRVKLLTLTEPSQEVARRTRRYLKKYRTASYLEAVKAVLKGDPDLAKSYSDEPRFRDLRLLANFLNTAKDKELREELSTDIRPLLVKPNSPAPAMALSQKLNSMVFAVRFVPVLDRKTGTVTRLYSRLVAVDASERARIYAILASAIQRRDISRLRQCRACGDFIVALDHRIVYCDNRECQNTKEDAKKERSKQSMRTMRRKRVRQRNEPTAPQESPLDRFIEFMRLQRKANLSEHELEKMHPVWRALRGVNAGRKLITAWEKKYDLKGSFQPWKLKRVWNREFTPEQRAIFS